VSRWKLTVRSEGEVAHEEFEELTQAVARMRERALELRAAAPPRPLSFPRVFKPEDQVTARLQLSGPGRLRRPTAGVDLRGDGTFVPYRGGLRREELDPSHDDTPFDTVRETLEDAGE
jgi:hypothetical protein